MTTGRAKTPNRSSLTLTFIIALVIRDYHHYNNYYLDYLFIISYNSGMKKISQSVNNAFAETGTHLKTWRIIYSLKAAQVAQRAGISLGTLHKIENGDPSVSTAAFLEVVRSLGLLDKLVDSIDPLNSDLGRARVTENLPQRIK